MRVTEAPKSERMRPAKGPGARPANCVEDGRVSSIFKPSTDGVLGYTYLDNFKTRKWSFSNFCGHVEVESIV